MRGKTIRLRINLAERPDGNGKTGFIPSEAVPDAH
jgi:hypothetical protein